MSWLVYAFSQVILRLIFTVRFGLTVTGHEHIPKTGPVILASNHLSFLDPPLLGCICRRPIRFMARSDLFKPGFLGWYLRTVRVMPLNRGEADFGAVRQAIQVLKAGEMVTIFPEGGRSLTGKLGEAKRGVGLLAEATKAPIVPVVIQGTYQALPPGVTKLQKAKIRVAFGPPIPYTSHSATSLEESSRAGQEGKVPSRTRHEQIAEAVTRQWRWLDSQLSA
jgi:1-acyl-sn-glycerol-3-phosphate acyltransferase